jgi:hypothetical protein
MKILSQQPWDTVVDFLVRFPDSPEEAKALGRIVYLLRDSIHEDRWRGNKFRIHDLLKENGLMALGQPFYDAPEDAAAFVNEMVYGDDDEDL